MASVEADFWYCLAERTSIGRGLGRTKSFDVNRSGAVRRDGHTRSNGLVASLSDTLTMLHFLCFYPLTDFGGPESPRQYD